MRFIMKIMSAKEVSAKTSFSIPHIRRMCNEGKFPTPISISESRKGWIEKEVEDWIIQCIRSNGKNID